MPRPRLVVVQALVLFCASLLLGALWLRQRHQEAVGRAVQVARDEASLLAAAVAPALSGGEHARLGRQLRQLGDATHLELAVLDAELSVLAATTAEQDLYTRPAELPEIRAALEDRDAPQLRLAASGRDQLVYVARAVEVEGRVVGYVRIASNLTPYRLEGDQGRSSLLLVALLLAGIGAASTLLLLWLSFEPVRRLASQARELASGHGGPKVSAAQRELRVLSEAFNALDRRLQEQLTSVAGERTRLLAILGSMVEGVVAVDRDERVVHLNAAAGEILGLVQQNGLGKRIWEVTRVPEVLEALAQTLRDGTRQRRELRLVRRGQELVIETQTSPIRGDGDGLIGAVMVLHDVSELRRLEAIRRDFVANVSHELKTPVTAIRGLAETLVDDPEMPADTQQRFLGKICDQSGRLSTLVKDLLTLARVEGEPGSLELAPLRLDAIARESLRAIHTVAERKSIRVEAQLPEQPVLVAGEREALRQIVDNLVDNAVKYTPEGGRVWLRLALVDGEARLEVQDTGIGIEPRHLQRVFERFYRVDKARSRELGGTGLGLSIVRHLCRALGGDVSVHSQVGKGSTFRVLLPLASQAASSLPDTPAVG